MQILRDTLLIFKRQMMLSLRNPAWLIIGVVQPILYLVLFAPLLKTIAGGPGFPPGDAWQVFVPGLLVQLGLFGAAFVGFAIVAEWRNGVIERMRVTPVSRLALLLGRVMRDAVTLLVQSIILLVTGVIMGLRAPFPGVLISLVIVVILAVSMASLSYAVGLKLKSEDALAPLLNSIAVPLLLLSGILLPLSLAPAWLNDISRINPFRYVVNALRDVFLGHYTTGSDLIGLCVAIGLAIVSVTIGTMTFRSANA